MAMTFLSFSMPARYVAPVRQLTPADLQPSKIWASVEDRSYRLWARSTTGAIAIGVPMVLPGAG